MQRREGSVLPLQAPVGGASCAFLRHLEGRGRAPHPSSGAAGTVTEATPCVTEGATDDGPPPRSLLQAGPLCRVERASRSGAGPHT